MDFGALITGIQQNGLLTTINGFVPWSGSSLPVDEKTVQVANKMSVSKGETASSRVKIEKPVPKLESSIQCDDLLKQAKKSSKHEKVEDTTTIEKFSSQVVKKLNGCYTFFQALKDRLIKKSDDLDLTDVELTFDEFSSLLDSNKDIKSLSMPIGITDDAWLEVVVQKLPHLQKLSLWGCDKIRHIKPLVNHMHISDLNLHFCRDIKDIDLLGNMPALKTLTGDSSVIVDLVRKRKEIPKLLKDLTTSLHANLNDITINEFSKILDNCKNIKTVILPNYADDSWLKVISKKLPNLEYLDISLCDKIKNLSEISNLESLTHLIMFANKNIRDISPLARLTKLVRLNLSECENIENINVVANFTLLEDLILQGCKKIKDLTPLSKHKSLSYIDLSGLEKIDNADLNNIAHLPLKILVLEGCKNIKDSDVELTIERLFLPSGKRKVYQYRMGLI